MQYLKSLIFSALFYPSAVIWSAVICVCRFRSRERRFSVVALWARWVLRRLERLCGLDYVVEGRENIPTDTTAVVYLKHSSVWETVAEIALCPPQTWVLKRELMWIPFVGWALSTLSCIPINRKGRTAAAQQVVRDGIERLDAGLNVMIFPEGTRMAAGETRRYGRSGALLAIKANRPLVPIAHNAGDFWPRRVMLKKPGTIRFCIGPAIETAGKTPEQVNTEAKNWIDMKMAEISHAHRTNDVPLDSGSDNAASAGTS